MPTKTSLFAIAYLLLVALPASADSGITASIIYPPFPDGSLQTALKPGDTFQIKAEVSPFIRTVQADLHELGLRTDISLDGSLGHVASEALTLPSTMSAGTPSIRVYGYDLAGAMYETQVPVVIDSSPPTGTIQASFSRPNDTTNSWAVHVSGSYSGTGSEAIITAASVTGYDASLLEKGSVSVDNSSLATIPSPFTASLHMPVPDPSWMMLSFGVTLIDEAGNISTIYSAKFPRIELEPVLINHAYGDSIVAASNYLPDGIPPGIGIPHSLINGLAQGKYFAVVFFSPLTGCPSNNYAINSFIPGVIWGHDTAGPIGSYSKAFSSSAGGCMQEFYVNPNRGEGWLWGALDNSGTSSAIADSNGIQAFAICSTFEACDVLSPVTSSSTASTTPGEKISNVLFLPGIKGSRLYKENILCGIASSLCDTPLWPPVSNIGISELFMDENGKSIERVYSKEHDVITNAFGVSFYDLFTARMNTIKNSTPNWRWEEAAYDWRMSLPDLMKNGKQDANRLYFTDASSTPYLMQELRHLASTSPTGKVTIIAHSNGGLVAKALMQELGEHGTSLIIDSVIFVGVPQSGAPRALAALLFGEGESLPSTGALSGFLMSAANARLFSLSAPMAYHLLPSALYAADVFDPLHPLISIGSGTLLSPTRAVFGSTIKTYVALLAYLRGEDKRVAPEKDDLRNPAIANTSLLTYAEEQHAHLDAWTPPKGISVYQIAGWGLDTISGVELYQQTIQTLLGKKERLAYRPQFIEDGDGTVPIPSALMMGAKENVHQYWVHLPELFQGYNHGTLFEIPEVVDLIASVLEGTTKTSGHVYTQQPQTEHPLKKLLFVLHDPATFTIRDSNGHSMKLSPSGTTGTLPGSQSGSLGESTYASVLADDTYTVRIDHAASDSLTFDVQERIDDVATVTSTFSTGTTPDTAITFTADKGNISAISVDTNGDGEEDDSVFLSAGETVFVEHKKEEVRKRTESKERAESTPSPVSQVLGVEGKKILPHAQPVIKTAQHTETITTKKDSPVIETPSAVQKVSWVQKLISWLRRIWDFLF